MSDLDNLDDVVWTPLTPATPTGARGRRADTCRCRIPEAQPGPTTWCLRCGCRVIDAEVSRRGKNNRNRGNAIEREIAKRLGLRRVGQFGGPVDADHPLWAAQVKSGASFPERLWGWLKGVETNAAQTALLVVTDAPGPGRRRRALVILDLDDWVDLHGPVEDAA